MTVIPFRSKAAGKNRATRTQSFAAFETPPPGVQAIGIDLGTTNSVVSLYRPGSEHPETLVFDGAQLVPSMIYWDADSERNIVGRRAKEELENDPARVVRSTKRSMGTQDLTFQSGDRAYTPEQAATLVLEHLASHEVLAQEIKEHGGVWAVVTVPAHFDDAARVATVSAAREAGIHVLRIVNEPTAAALAYSMLPDVRDLQSETVAVYDLGGGTFDVSIVEREGLVFNVLASEGDVQLGGDDLDEALANQLLEHVHPKLSARRAGRDSDLFRKLLYHAELAKIAFQSEGLVQIHDSDLDGRGATIDVTLSRDAFEEAAAPFVARTLELTERAMHAARKRPSQISRILLVGGSTRVNLVHKMLEGYFPGCLVDARLEPDLAVSWGASVQSAIILGIEPDTILVDVCSHSLGIGVAEDSRSVNENFRSVARKFGIHEPVSDERLHELLGPRVDEFNHELQSMLRVAPIIYRNSPLPARRSEFFSTLYENQAAVQVIVAQGEGDTVGKNRLMGSFLFELEQPCPAGARCEIQLTYDVNGMVHVLARQLGTSNEAEALFDSRTGEVTGWRSLQDDDELGAGDGLSGVFPDAGRPERAGTLPPLPNLAHLSPPPRPPQLSPIEPASPFAEKASAPKSTGTPMRTGPEAEVRVLNALLIRARKALTALGPTSGPAKSLQELTLEYSRLLNEAQTGSDNDVALESVEGKILSLLEQVQK